MAGSWQGKSTIGRGTNQFHNSNRCKGGNKMNPSTKDEMAGKVHEVKGTIKEKVGQLTNDPDLEGEGIVENIGGKIQTKIGQTEKAIEKL
jgi:uncharacterized protein YjbJ (UPF0337 family)